MEVQVPQGFGPWLAGFLEGDGFISYNDNGHAVKSEELRRCLDLSGFIAPRDETEATWMRETLSSKRERRSEYQSRRRTGKQEVWEYVKAHPEVVERLKKEGKI